MLQKLGGKGKTKEAEWKRQLLHASKVELHFSILELRREGTLGKENIPGKDMVVRIISGQRGRLRVGNKLGSTDQKH